MKDEDPVYADEKTEHRAHEAIRRSFNMPRTRHREIVGKVGRPKRWPLKDAKKAK